MDIYVKAEKKGHWLHDGKEGGTYLVKIFVPMSLKDVRKEVEVDLDDEEINAAITVAAKLNEKDLGFKLKVKVVNEFDPE